MVKFFLLFLSAQRPTHSSDRQPVGLTDLLLLLLLLLAVVVVSGQIEQQKQRRSQFHKCVLTGRQAGRSDTIAVN